METFLPAPDTIIRNAYSHGVYDDSGLASIANSRELLLREHVISCLYWAGGVDPLQADMLHRVDEVLSTRAARDAYMAHYRYWGQHMTQARLEGLAVKKERRDFIIPDAKICPPLYFYPTVALDFVAKNYLPGTLAVLRNHPQDRSCGAYAPLYDRAAIRAREVICLLAIFEEHARERAVLSDYCLLLDRTIFTVFALAPVLSLGMPRTFGEFVRHSILSITAYFYTRAKTIRACFQELPPCYYDELLGCLAELSNLKPRVTPYYREDDDYLDAAS
jgi:hypothetical protein